MVVDKLLEFVFYSIPGTNVVSSIVRFYALFWIALYHEFQSKDFGVSLKRLAILFSLFVFFPCLLVWNHLGFMLDDIFFPAWKKCPIHEPCFIVGNARSGTTWLHRLLVTSIQGKFTTFKTWEILFAPSVVWKRLFIMLYNWDSMYCGSLLYHCLQYAEKFLIPSSQLHEIGLQLAEEDEWLLIHISFAQLMCFFFPCAGIVLGKLIMFDLPDDADTNKISIYSRKMMFQFYKKCVQRHLFARFVMEGIPVQNVVFVSKNPAFTLRLESLYNTFPDCKVVCLLRDPSESVPSMVSYIAKVYHAFSAPRIVYPNARDLLAYCITHYQYPLIQLNEEKRPLNQWSFVKYNNLKHHLQETLVNLLQRLGIASAEDLVGDATFRLAAEQQLTKKYQSKHKHSVEACCGMDETELKSILKVVYEAHNFE